MNLNIAILYLAIITSSIATVFNISVQNYRTAVLTLLCLVFQIALLIVNIHL